MFSGIVKARGTVARVEPRGGDLRLTVTCADIDWNDFEAGESICVNGVCLTATSFEADGFTADVSNETMRVTALTALAPGSCVNLEPSLAIGDRLGGHFVSGHVDCVGTVEAVAAEGRSMRLTIGVPHRLGRYVAPKGSICVDGTSLTINAVSGDAFEVNIIPHTAAATIVEDYRVGTRVNIEVDLLARYIDRLLSAGDDGGLTRQFLREHGYG